MQSKFPGHRKKVIIDCDVGVDDALALVLAFHSPELEVQAVTGVNGNVPLEQVFSNIQKVLALIQPPKPPLIAKGADRPLGGKSIYSHSVHGEDGLGGVQIDFPEGEKWWHRFSGPAAELIPEIARKDPGEIILIAVGPLTNLALAFRKDPEGMKALKETVIMGGAVRTRGNITSHAEFNIFTDPLAAQIVLASAMPITLVPLDATHQVALTPEFMEHRIHPSDSRFSRFLREVTGYDPGQRHFRGGAKDIFLHDPLAVGVVIDPGLVRKESLFLTVETEEGESFGRISEVGAGPRKIDVCLTVDSGKFLDLFISRLSVENHGC
ncbi:MAG: nucleoside hydrolase [Deltaproteobacteria bacterium]|nr:nucleoside hydrolase [Deltaproteobacteria bacterium]